MIQLNFNALLEESICILCYIAGKRAKDADEYFRLAPCKDDMLLLQKFAEEALERLATNLIRWWKDHYLTLGTLVIEIDVPENFSSDRVIYFIKAIVISSIVSRWLNISNNSATGEWQARTDALIDSLRTRLRSEGKLILRRLSPM